MKRAIEYSRLLSDWFSIGISLASFGEDGRQLFHRVSKMSGKYNATKCDEKFDNLCETASKQVSLGTFFEHCKRHNIPLAEILKPFNPKLNIVPTKENYWDQNEREQHSQRVQNLQKNRDHRAGDYRS
ncbi:PriCT-2 domain-containing protein [Rhodohalobacter sp.]|uniref:PriCT-2 domain-containing protein n=1 Tax=Rhodohalobacter sp. TaxID=1974210 RepID=UPI002AD86B3A|nr:PriCT-2 domain-containing protein [Rhodohalobacter sp.]